MTDHIQMPTAMKSVGSVSRSVSNNITSASPIKAESTPISMDKFSPFDGGSNIIKILLIVFVIAFLGYNLYLYYYEGTDILAKFLGINILSKGETNVEPEPEETLAEEDELAREEDQKLERKVETPVQEVIGEPSKKPEDQTEADISTESEIQQTKKGNYCYIGTDRTYRSCVEMNAGDTCVSGEVFPTKDICVNPELRR